MMERVSKGLVYVGAIFYMASMALAVANMVLRPMGHSITGTYELLGFGCAAFVALGLGFSAMERVHISVDILMGLFPKGIARVLEAMGYVIAGLCSLVSSYGIFRLALRYIEVNEVSETLQVPFYPVVLMVALGFMVFGVAFFHQSIRALR